MYSLFSTNVLYLLFLSSISTATAKHVHQPRHHYHQNRIGKDIRADSPSASRTSILPAISATSAVVPVIDEIEQDLAVLPNKLVQLIEDVDKRLKAMESLLQSTVGLDAAPSPSYIPGAGSGLPPSTVGSTSSPSTTWSQTFSGPGTTIAASPFPSVFIAPPITQSAVVTLPPSVPALGYNRTSNMTLPTSSVTTSPTLASTLPAYFNTSQPTSTPYVFNASANDNVAVYYGQTADTQVGGLFRLCQDPSVDIVIMAFVYDFFSQGGYPTVVFGPGCWIGNAVQQAVAPGLFNCTALTPEMLGCQQIGKKILVSLGGSVGNSTFSSDTEAQQFAVTVWDLFGGGTGRLDPDLRPFGTTVTVDGFDIDNESHNPDYYYTFATTLREMFASDPSKTYYLSAAPQCPMPDASIPQSVMNLADFVWVQFYNNPQCNFNSTGFESSLVAWSGNLTTNSTNMIMPKLYIGLPAFAGAGSEYVDGLSLMENVKQAREVNPGLFSGIMLWDGSEALSNVDQYGVDYLSYAKASLEMN